MLRVVFVTAPVKKAEALARQLLEERLIACANLIPKVKSMYWWKDKIETDAETLIVMKTPKRNIKNLIRRVKDLHPYEVPEAISIPVEDGYRPYLQWAEEETKQGR